MLEVVLIRNEQEDREREEDLPEEVAWLLEDQCESVKSFDPASIQLPRV